MPLANGGYIAIGSHRPNGTSTYGALYRFDSNFGISWIMDYGPNFKTNGEMVVLPNGEGYAFAGIGTPSGTTISTRAALIKTDTNGVVGCRSSIVPPQYLTITTQPATVTNITSTISSVGYSLSQTSLPPQTMAMHFVDLCNPVAIENLDQEPAMSVFPNPTDKSISLHLQEDSKIVMFDTVGRNSFERLFTKGTHQIEFGNFSVGTYFIVATDVNGLISRTRLVIAR